MWYRGRDSKCRSCVIHDQLHEHVACAQETTKRGCYVIHSLQNEDEGGRKMALLEPIPLSPHIATVSNSGDRLNTKQAH